MELAADVTGASLLGDSSISVTQVTCDSRKVKPGALFCAIEGSRADGHAYVESAVRGGAVAVLSRRPRMTGAAAWLQVPDDRRGMAEAACTFWKNPSFRMRVTGITGTNGKTTVAVLTGHMLRSAGRRCGILGTIQYDLEGEVLAAPNTTPQPADLQEYLAGMLERGAQFASMEVSSHALDLGRVHGMRFATAVFTNLSRDHLDYHGDMEKYFAAKRRLFEMLGEDAWAILPEGDEWAERIAAACRARILRYGMGPEAQVRAENLQMSRAGIRMTLATPSGRGPLESVLVGMPNVKNLLAAAAAGCALGLSFEEIRAGLSAAPPVRGRFERLRCEERGFDVWVDYAHTPDALRAVLETARALRPRRVLAVFGCGGDRDRGKRVPMARAVAELADRVYLTSDNPRSEDPESIMREAEPGLREFRRPGEYVLEADRRRAIEGALAEAGAGDIVVIAGKGHETYQILGNRTVPFDDRAVAEEILGLRAARGKTA
jgi:UDP-N-acetylmuramoyl-L-alanyl-D-glutamate--2,6-diaminopimelate ligase